MKPLLGHVHVTRSQYSWIALPMKPLLGHVQSISHKTEENCLNRLILDVQLNKIKSFLLIWPFHVKAISLFDLCLTVMISLALWG